MATNTLGPFITSVETQGGVNVPDGGHTHEKDLVFVGRITSSVPETVEIRDLRNKKVLGEVSARPGTPFRVEVNGLEPLQYVVAAATKGNDEDVERQWGFTVI
ncbi:hypothetical protein [Pseudomonas fluorescens]|uniref:hypothetical protein n=1 Tax=Pseudomonas fluorescens TaxID=294 RepID=UPI000937BA4B|nr:hypothetical protein [Pseudomonas fluorescens]